MGIEQMSPYEQVTYWLPDRSRVRGQGKRLGGGMVRGAMAAAVSFQIRYDSSLGEFLEFLSKVVVKDATIKVNIRNVIFDLPSGDYEKFSADPAKYILDDVAKRFSS